MRGSQSLLEGAASLPWAGVSALNGNVRQASNGYGTTSTTTKDPWGTVTGLAGAAAAGAGAYYSDARVKNLGPQIGKTPEGIPLYDFTYKGDPSQTPQVGPVAQEVAQVRPDAVGQEPGGTMTVDYGKLGLPDPTTLAGGAGQITPQALPNAYGNKDNVDRSFGGILGRFTSPDASTTAGKIGLLGQYLMHRRARRSSRSGRGCLRRSGTSATGAKRQKTAS